MNTKNISTRPVIFTRPFLFSTLRHTAGFVVLLLLSITTSANVYTVTTTADVPGTTSLRGAITDADAIGGTHTINVPAGTYNLTSGQITFGNRAENITINGAGPGATIINMTATAQNRIFLINPTGTVTGVSITINGVAFSNGRLTSDIFGGGAICAGGPSNSLALTNCAFTNNTLNPSLANSQYGGGAIAYTYGGALTIDQCTFTGNSAASSSFAKFGGAVYYYVYSSGGIYPNASLSVTNSTFNNNTVSTNGAGGGLYIEIAATTSYNPTISASVTENNFTNNGAPGGSGVGGAIKTINAFNNASVNINYNRFRGNTSGSGNGTALAIDESYGDVNATNNWWGCNGGPTGSNACADKAFVNPNTLGPNNTYPITPFLQLKTTAASTSLCSGSATTITAGFTSNSAGNSINSSNLTALVGLPVTFSAALGTISGAQTTIQSNGNATATYTSGATGGNGTVNALVDAVPSSDATARASITVNTAPAIIDPPDNTTVCAGSTASFNVVASGSGTLGYQWYKGSTALSNGATGTGSTIAGATTATLTITNTGTADALNNYNVRVSTSVGCGTITSGNASLTVNTLPAITDPPDNTSACIGSPASFTVVATGSGTLSYQWYKGTTLITSATSATYTINSVATTDAATNYNVRVSSSTGCTPVTSGNASLTVNTPLAINSQPANVTGTCVGNPVSFSTTATGSGTLSYQWYKGATLLVNGPTGTGSIISGATTTTLTIANPGTADNAANYNVKVTSTTGCTPATSNNATLLLANPVTATSTSSGSKTISSTNTVITNASCNLIATVVPSGTSPVGGTVNATVTITPTVQTSPNGSPYAQRHYDIVPATNPTTATATLTLYFTQAEFTAYNAAPNHNTNLPVDATDAANNKANIRIFQYHGTGTLPGNYTGTSEEINPVDNNIVYNSTYSRWEITFSVTSFSGFYLASAGSLILPLNLLSFTGFTDGSTASLQWKTTNEKDVSYFEIERSTNAAQFTKVGQVAAGNNSYSFIDKPTTQTVYYYRLKIVDKDGKYSYSEVVAINLKKAAALVQVLPNPFIDKIMINISATQASKTEIRLTDMSGKTLVRKNITLQPGTNAITLTQLQYLKKGTYILQVFDAYLHESVKVVKAD